jgi:5-methylcytosine-specific restriction endonuclease McrA
MNPDREFRLQKALSLSRGNGQPKVPHKNHQWPKESKQQRKARLKKMLTPKHTFDKIGVSNNFIAPVTFINPNVPVKIKKSKKQKDRRKAYEQYISHSKVWKSKRKQAFKLYGRKCDTCGAKKNLHVHHKTYANLFNEKMEDLQILCEPCHMKLHDRESKFKKDEDERLTSSPNLLA